VSANMAVGFVRYLRNRGYSEATLWLYKAVITVDAPVQLLGKALQYCWRRARGRHKKAEKSLLALRGTQHFLAKGLTPFWRA
jgi:N-acetylglucosaminyl-diphospho-decaprenol L-rhamnosyltransferase